jgi:segregation and condensation protein A
VGVLGAVQLDLRVDVMDTPIYRLAGLVIAKDEAREDFEGPLDLILYLLAKHKMDIAELRITDLLAQYMAWMETRRRMDLEVASEFVAMASHLVYLKTRALLRLEDEPDDELEELKRSLEERRRREDFGRLQCVADTLADRAAVGQRLIVKPPEPLSIDHTYTRTHDPASLTEAIRSLTQRGQRKLPPPASSFTIITAREVFPVEGKIEDLLVRLRKAGRLLWRSLFRGVKSRSELVAVFLAVLEICRSGQAALEDEQLTLHN